jgi:hypothetical protein
MHLSPEKHVVNLFVELHVTHHVIGQIDQPNLCRCSEVADSPDVQDMHRIVQKAENMHHSGAMTRFSQFEAF